MQQEGEIKVEVREIPVFLLARNAQGQISSMIAGGSKPCLLRGALRSACYQYKALDRQLASRTHLGVENQGTLSRRRQSSRLKAMASANGSSGHREEAYLFTLCSMQLASSQVMTWMHIQILQYAHQLMRKRMTKIQHAVRNNFKALVLQQNERPWRIRRPWSRKWMHSSSTATVGSYLQRY